MSLKIIAYRLPIDKYLKIGIDKLLAKNSYLYTDIHK